MAQGPRTQTNIPQADLEFRKSLLELEGFKVEVRDQGNGLFTLIATGADQSDAEPGVRDVDGGVSQIDPATAPVSVAGVPFANLTASEHAWPIKNPSPDRTVSYRTNNGALIGRLGREFGADRQGRRHVGIDLFAAEGDEVVACEDGVIVGLQHFTGPTQAMFIQCDSGLVIKLR